MSVAVPLVTGCAPPMGFPLTENCTVPVAAEGETVAVSVSLVPTNCGLAGSTLEIVVVVGMAVTVKLVALAVCELAYPLPEVAVKAAVRLSGFPMGRALVV
ncbi:MAG: hypothetical protein P4L86_21965, partial [Mycobacterium sp.]|nr:hypothetical protein [Mycobacterium sp.]